MHLNLETFKASNLFTKTALFNNFRPTMMKEVGALRSRAVSISNRLVDFNEVARLEQKAVEEENIYEWASVVVTDGEEPTTNKLTKKKERLFEQMQHTSRVKSEHFTLEWLTKHAPIGSLSSLTVSQRKAILKRRPAAEYDILPLTLRNSPYIIQFDMENPRPRFLIKHRQANCSFKGLSEDDKIELVRVSLHFAEKFGVKDLILKIPMIESSNIATVYGKFYAYLLCSNQELYIRLFNSYVKDYGIPFWPSTNRWVTPLWIPKAIPQEDDSCYIESVMINAALFPDQEPDLLGRRHFNFKNIASAAVSEERFDDFETFSWEEHLLVGVKSHAFNKASTSPLDRWQFLQFMSDVLTDLERKKPRTRCSMLLSLARPFVLRKRHKAVGMIKFAHKLPHCLKSKYDTVDHLPDPSIRVILEDLSYKELDVNIVDEKWVLIEEVTNASDTQSVGRLSLQREQEHNSSAEPH